MKLKEYISYKFNTGVLDVYDRGEHILHQPFNSESGAPFRDVDAALAWLLNNYPNLYTPS